LKLTKKGIEQVQRNHSITVETDSPLEEERRKKEGQRRKKKVREQ